MANEPVERLSNSWISRRLEVHVDVGRELISLGVYVIRAATAKEAITLLETYEEAVYDDEAWDVFKEITLGWIPVRLSSTLISPRFDREDTINIVLGINRGT